MSYDETLRLKPDHAAAHYGLARIASDTGRFSEALDYYEKLRRLDPDAILALCGIAEVKSSRRLMSCFRSSRRASHETISMPTKAQGSTTPMGRSAMTWAGTTMHSTTFRQASRCCPWTSTWNAMPPAMRR